jgi:hypothetical protein
MRANMRMFMLLLLISFLFVFLYKQDDIEQFSSGSTYAILVIAGVAVALLAGYLLMKGGNVFPM